MSAIKVDMNSTLTTRPLMLNLLALYDKYIAQTGLVLKHVPREAIVVHWLDGSLPNEDVLMKWLKEDYWPYTSRASTAIRKQFMLNNVPVSKSKFKIYELGEHPYPFSCDLELTDSQREWVAKYTFPPKQ